MPEDQLEITQEKIREVYQAGGPVRFETRRLTKDGRCLDMIISAAAKKDEAGNGPEMVVNLTDITERKRIAHPPGRSGGSGALGTGCLHPLGPNPASLKRQRSIKKQADAPKS